MKVKLTLMVFLLSALSMKAQQRNIPIRCFDEEFNEVTDFYSRLINGNDSTPFMLNKKEYTLTKPGKFIVEVSKFGYFNQRDTFDYKSEGQITSAPALVKIVLKENAIEQSSAVVKATRVDKNSAFAYTNITGKELKTTNLGQDFTYLIANTPSAVTTSDAGAGVGYTGIRIRGSDATRINVTINGIPINDAESHGVYWVNMPDLASSSGSVQIQRGVGTSTNGNGSFGANISINNIENNTLPGLQLQQSYGSFNTMKSNMKFSTGKMGNFSFSGRLSKIRSDGYIDRASSDLSAFQFNLNYYKKGWAVNAVSFGGKEKTYQSWYGTPESRYKGDKDAMQAYSDRNYLSVAQHDNLLNSGRTYNFYDYKNQTDNYWQNHYQLHIGKELGKYLVLKTSFFTTTGKGFYEEYKEGAKFSNYRAADFISPSKDTFRSTNLVRQKWLDNIYYGNFTSMDYAKRKLKVNAGFGITNYDGNHFGKVIWAEIAQPFGKDFEFYREKSRKSEVNGFAKISYQATKALNLMAELQMRNIHYQSHEIFPKDSAVLQFKQHYSFFNPKVGLNYQLSKNQQVYASMSIGNREPVRSDFTDNTDSTLPKPEQLQDIEFGWIYKGKSHFVQINGYYMNYKNQLVLTGDLNDVGNPLRKNVAQSYRMGVELIGMKSILKGRTVLEGNLTLSQNKIKQFQDVYYNYGNNFDSYIAVKNNYTNTDISFSPNAIGYIGITDKHIRNFQIGINMKYVGKQYLDNTSNNGSKIDQYTTLNLHFLKEFRIKNVQSLAIKGMVNNLASINYTNNGYTYKYISNGQLITENFYYPQALINFMLGVDVKF